MVSTFRLLRKTNSHSTGKITQEWQNGVHIQAATEDQLPLNWKITQEWQDGVHIQAATED